MKFVIDFYFVYAILNLMFILLRFVKNVSIFFGDFSKTTAATFIESEEHWMKKRKSSLPFSGTPEQ